MMTAKDYLRSVRRMQLALQAKQERLEQMRALAQSISARRESTPAHGGAPGDRVGHLVATIVDFEREVAEELQALLRRQKRVERCLQKMGFEHRTVLERYYLSGMRWDDVAEAMHYSVRRVYDFHKQALVEFTRWLQADIIAQKAARRAAEKGVGAGAEHGKTSAEHGEAGAKHDEAGAEHDGVSAARGSADAEHGETDIVYIKPEAEHGEAGVECSVPAQCDEANAEYGALAG